MRFFMGNEDYESAVRNNPEVGTSSFVEYYERSKVPIPWPDPTPEMLVTPEFEAVWQCIKYWDINVPGAYGGYCEATGNHVRAILDALARARTSKVKE
jgi:hypothetical protein